MNITKNDIDSLNAEIVISVKPEDYESRVNEGIKHVQKKAQMPGFRPGKVPAGLIKKQYGTQILVDEINKLLNDSIYKYIEENKIEILGNPIPKNQTSVDFTKQRDFEFVYELGLVPEFNVTLSPDFRLDYKTVKVDDELVEKYVRDVKKNYGKATNPEIATETDTIYMDINELDENGNIKPGGIFKSTNVNLLHTQSAVAKEKLAGVKVGDKVVMNVNDLYTTAVDKSVSLGIDREQAESLACNLQLSVKNISRLEDAELNQELFDRIYGEGKIQTEEEFRNKVREELKHMFAADSERLFRREVENKLLEKINPRLPDSFFKKMDLGCQRKTPVC